VEQRLLNCWEIENCGREEGGSRVKELGECIASKEEMGHSCWIIAGTLCGGKVQGSLAQKNGFCTSCNVYKLYNRSSGKQGKEISCYYPEENEKYKKIILKKNNSLAYPKLLPAYPTSCYIDPL